MIEYRFIFQFNITIFILVIDMAYKNNTTYYVIIKFN